MAGHTPGPWAYSEDDGALWVYQADDAAHTPHASDVGLIRLHGVDPSVVQRANARLIAAAPELLEACELFVQEYGLRKGPNDELDPADEQSAPVASAMRAIAKATEPQA